MSEGIAASKSKDGITMRNVRPTIVKHILPTMLLFGGIAHCSYGQSSLSLAPLKPITPAEPTPQFRAPAAPVINAPNAANTVAAKTAAVTTVSATEPYAGMKPLLPPPMTADRPQVSEMVSTTPIELQPIPKYGSPIKARVASGQGRSVEDPKDPKDSKDPIAVSPLKPVAGGNQPKTITGPISVDSMIGPAADPSSLFLRSNTNRTFLEGAEMLPVMRQQIGMYGQMEWGPSGYCWQSPAFCYSPLYFEQPNLERYGQGKGRPFASTVSAAVFVGQVTTLPIAMFHTPHWCNECTLGHHRPGNCAPFQRKPDHSQ
jgi:hypothetical protein